jgi:hypothetical protein
VPRYASAEQGCHPVGHAIDRGVRVAATRLRLDLPGTPQIDDDETDEGVSTAGILADHDTDTADEGFVPGDGRKESVFCVRLQLVRYIKVLARKHDAHTDGSGKL